MKTFSQISVTLFGLISGGMLLIATGLVPYWRALDTAAFTEAFSQSLPTVGGTMIVLTILTTGTMVTAAGLAAWKKDPSRLWMSFGAAATLGMLVTVPLYFGTANSVLSVGALDPEAITAELAKWQQMHWIRTTLGILGLFCAVRAGYAHRS